ncbi:MAG: hypothetical protein ACP5OG_00110 [Candidatus Nanoarchaeia archaeon]
METPALDKNIVFMNKKCFPLEINSTKEFTMQLKRIAKDNGLKYKEVTTSPGMGGWISRTIAPIIYRKVLKPKEDISDLTNYSEDHIAYFKDDYFIVKKGYEELEKDIKELYEMFSMVREAENEIKRNRDILHKIELAEKDSRLENTCLKPEEIIEIMDKIIPDFKTIAQIDFGFNGKQQIPDWYWTYSRVGLGKNLPNKPLFKLFEDILYHLKESIELKFYEKANISEISKEFYKKYQREGERIIIPKKYR